MFAYKTQTAATSRGVKGTVASTDTPTAAPAAAAKPPAHDDAANIAAQVNSLVTAWQQVLTLNDVAIAALQP